MQGGRTVGQVFGQDSDSEEEEEIPAEARLGWETRNLAHIRLINRLPHFGLPLLLTRARGSLLLISYKRTNWTNMSQPQQFSVTRTIPKAASRQKKFVFRLTW